MKKCTKQNKPAKQFPDVVAGDTVRITTGGVEEEYLVCFPLRIQQLRLVCLGDGVPWSSNQLWGSSLKPEQVEKVDLCYCEAEE